MEERLSKIIEKWRWDDGSICSDIDSDIKAFIKAELAKEFDRGVAQGIELGHKSASDLADLELKANDKKWETKLKKIVDKLVDKEIVEMGELENVFGVKLIKKLALSDSLLERKKTNQQSY